MLVTGIPLALAPALKSYLVGEEGGRGGERGGKRAREREVIYSGMIHVHAHVQCTYQHIVTVRGSGHQQTVSVPFSDWASDSE